MENTRQVWAVIYKGICWAITGWRIWAMGTWIVCAGLPPLLPGCISNGAEEVRCDPGGGEPICEAGATVRHTLFGASCDVCEGPCDVWREPDRVDAFTREEGEGERWALIQADAESVKLLHLGHLQAQEQMYAALVRNDPSDYFEALRDIQNPDPRPIQNRGRVRGELGPEVERPGRKARRWHRSISRYQEPSTELIERAARAIFETDQDLNELSAVRVTWEGQLPGVREGFRRFAEAAFLACVREAEQAMKRADNSFSECPWCNASGNVVECGRCGGTGPEFVGDRIPFAEPTALGRSIAAGILRDRVDRWKAEDDSDGSIWPIIAELEQSAALISGDPRAWLARDESRPPRGWCWVQETPLSGPRDPHDGPELVIPKLGHVHHGVTMLPPEMVSDLGLDRGGMLQFANVNGRWMVEYPRAYCSRKHVTGVQCDREALGDVCYPHEGEHPEFGRVFWYADEGSLHDATGPHHSRVWYGQEPPSEGQQLYEAITGAAELIKAERSQTLPSPPPEPEPSEFEADVWARWREGKRHFNQFATYYDECGQVCSPYRCTRPTGHEGKHGNSYVIWDASMKPEKQEENVMKNEGTQCRAVNLMGERCIRSPGHAGTHDCGHGRISNSSKEAVTWREAAAEDMPASGMQDVSTLCAAVCLGDVGLSCHRWSGHEGHHHDTELNRTWMDEPLPPMQTPSEDEDHSVDSGDGLDDLTDFALRVHRASEAERLVLVNPEFRCATCKQTAVGCRRAACGGSDVCCDDCSHSSAVQAVKTNSVGAGTPDQLSSYKAASESRSPTPSASKDENSCISTPKTLVGIAPGLEIQGYEVWNSSTARHCTSETPQLTSQQEFVQGTTSPQETEKSAFLADSETLPKVHEAVFSRTEKTTSSSPF